MGDPEIEEFKVEALLALRGRGFPAVGTERIAMLEAVITEGTITGAAKALGYSYKSVWDGIAAINNLLPRPAVIAQAGGAKGGQAEVTADGQRLIADFRRLEERLNRISAALTADSGASLGQIWWSVGMKTSARNVFRCRVAGVQFGTVNVQVILSVAEGIDIIATITRGSAEDLRIGPGREVIALVKSSFVILAPGIETPQLSTPNKICGTVTHRIDGEISCEITLDIGNSKSLTSVITRTGAETLALAPGNPVWALFDPSHVILVTD